MDSTVKLPMSADDVAPALKAAIRYARNFAKRQGLFKRDPDEVESCAGMALAYAIKNYRGEATFETFLFEVIARQLLKAARDAVRPASDDAETNVELDQLAAGRHWRPSSTPPTERKRGAA